MQRRQFLAAFGAAALSACRGAGPDREPAEEPPLTVITPYPQDAFEAVIRAASAPLSRRLGRGVSIEVVPGDGGWEAITRLLAGDPASTVLAEADLSLALKQELGRRGFTFSQLRPVAKLTEGLSVALVTRADGPLGSWDAMRSAAEARRLRLLSTGPLSAYGVAQRLLEATAGARFKAVAEAGPQAILEAVAADRADLGLVTTVLIERFNAAHPGAGVVPLVTFGAQRSERYPQTPTLAELARDNKRDFTFALGLFGAAAMPARIAHGLYEALQAIETDPEVRESAIHADVPLRVRDADTLRAAFERDLRLVRRLAALSS